MNRNRFKHASDYKKDWLDWWLSDDAPPPSLESTLANQQLLSHLDKVEPVTEPLDDLPAEELGATHITVNLNLPKIKPPDLKKLKKPKLKALPKPKRAVVLLSAYAVVMLLAGVVTHSLVFSNPASHEVAQGTTNSQQVLAANNTVATKASFTPIAPASHPELGAYAKDKTYYDPKRDEYSYMDSMQGDQFTVSQQVLPEKYSSGQDAVDKISASLAAKEPIVTASGIAYMNTAADTGKQTIVLSMKGLIVFIQSGAKHSVSDWANYIATLK